MAMISSGAGFAGVSRCPDPPSKGLQIRGLNKSFRIGSERRHVLRDINLSMGPGDFVAIVGPSGSGKSTLLRIIAGLETPDPDPPDAILLDGATVLGPGPDRGFVFQSASTFPFLTAIENVMFGLENLVADRRERERIATEYLDLVGLSDRADDYPKSLSGGQCQRVAIARTLATRPKLLLMDEPYGALDALTRENQQIELLRIWREARPTVLLVTHDIQEAALLAQRVVVLGRNPASIIEEIDVEAALARAGGRTEGIRECKEFQRVVARIKASLPRAED